MSRSTGIWLITATSLVVGGLIMFAVLMSVNHWDFAKLSTVKYETNTHHVSEEFSNISIKSDTADILFVPSDDEICKVVCYESENANHSATVQDDTLTINVVDERKWYEHIGIALGTPKITVYLPEAEYGVVFIKDSTGDIGIPKDFRFESIDISTSTGDVKVYSSALEVIKIKTSTGDIRVENVYAGALELSVSTGEVIARSITCDGDFRVDVSTGDTKLTDVECKSVVSNGSTGDIYLRNVIAAEKFSVERSTGDVMFENCDAAELFIKTDTGDITGSLLTDKIFIIETDTGYVDVPKTVNGGRCEITSNTGDIRLDIP